MVHGWVTFNDTSGGYIIRFEDECQEGGMLRGGGGLKS